LTAFLAISNNFKKILFQGAINESGLGLLSWWVTQNQDAEGEGEEEMEEES
jgi:hypothetical protein